jgi:hypothetical protein
MQLAIQPDCKSDWRNLITANRFCSCKEGRHWTPLLGYRHFCEVDYSTPAPEVPVAGDPVYCSSLVTSCCTLLACAKAEMPVWLRISYFDMLEDADA